MLSKRPIAFVADVHLHNYKDYAVPAGRGLNSRGADCCEVLRRAIAKAKEENAVALVIAGDLFNYRRPEPAILAGAIRVLVEESGKDIDIVIIPGNHDMMDASAAEGNTAVEVLHREAYVVNEPEVLTLGPYQVVCMPYQSTEPMALYVPNLLASLGKSEGPRVFAGHTGVYDDTSPSWMSQGRDAIHAGDFLRALESVNIRTAFVGHFHKHRIWSPVQYGRSEVVQIGTLCPATYSDAGTYPMVGGMALFDGRDVRMVEIPGPRFAYVENITEAGVVVDSQRGYTTYERPTPDKVAVEKALEGHLIPNVDDARAALASFCSRLDLPSGVLSTEVVAEVDRIWSTVVGEP